MWLEKRCVLIYTDEVPTIGDLYVTTNGLFHIGKESSLSDMIKLYGAKKVLLYIVSSENMRIGDSFIANQSVKKCVAIKNGDYPFEVEKDGEYTQHHSKIWNGNTIIASNDSTIDKPFINDVLLKMFLTKYKHHKPTRITVDCDENGLITMNNIINIKL